MSLVAWKTQAAGRAYEARTRLGGRGGGDTSRFLSLLWDDRMSISTRVRFALRRVVFHSCAMAYPIPIML